MTIKEINTYFNKQYLRYGGFCGYCGEGVKPLLNNDEATFGLCEYDGEHPRCSGEHHMEFEGKTPEVFGGYEIWVCTNPECDYSESY